MSLEDELRQIAGTDQVDSAARTLALMAATYWLTLIEKGIPPSHATQLTLPLVIKTLGGGA